MKRPPRRGVPRARAALLGLLLAGAAHAEVRVLTGPTPIVDGAAHSARDITVVNERLAFALAVQSPVPFGVPRGAIVDVAPVANGVIGRSRTVFADFIPNNWSAWPNTYQHVEIVEHGPQRAVVRATRDFGRVTVTTVYTLEQGADRIAIKTTMRNEGSRPLSNLLSGLTLWPKGGYFFAVPGLAGLTEGSAKDALADWAAGYDADWLIALHAPYLDHVGSDSRDLLKLHSLAPGQTHTFEGFLQVVAQGDLAPVLRFASERRNVVTGMVRGRVDDAEGRPVEQPIVVIEKDGKPLGWVMGHSGTYEAHLPTGRYALYATAKAYSESALRSLRVGVGQTRLADFLDLQPPGKLSVAVNDAQEHPLDARLVITVGQKPLVGFLGRRTFFTELERKGQLDLTIAPGTYVFEVSFGGAFLAAPAALRAMVAPEGQEHASVQLQPLFDPTSRGWYSADLHHHADQAEAVTPPDDLARSQLAAGLDALFVSDHDSTVNHARLIEIARQRNVTFIPSIELSPSWGHFNAYPLRPSQKLQIDTSTASVEDILREARRQGALVIQVNHPFIPYGYFASLQAGVAPGGFDPGFDLVEINATVPQDDMKVLHALWGFWNAHHRFYLSGGTDTHDVWSDESGRLRTFAHLEGALSPASFAGSLRAGHAYVSRGPLIYPRVMFGSDLRVRPEAPFTLAFDLQSVAGLKEVQLIGDGAVAETRFMAEAPQNAHVDFSLRAARSGWYALIVEDRLGQKAYTDPIWIDVVDDAATVLGKSS